MDSNLMIQGTELMLLGMGIVFGFLGVLVITLRGMSWLADRLYRPTIAEAPEPAPIDISDQRRVIAVIGTAVARYRASHDR